MSSLVGTALIGPLTSLLKVVWKWLHGRHEVNTAIWRYRRQIMCTDSESKLSEILLELKSLYQNHDELFMRPHLQEFYDVWPGDPLLDLIGEHSRFNGIADIADGIRDLRADTMKLLHP